MIGDRWGASAEEIRADYPCDRYVSAPTLEAWRAVTIEAPVGAVWASLIQMRLAPYSYDLIDNGFRRSPRELLHLDDPAVGDPFSASRGRPLGRVVAVEHGDHLTGRMMGAVMTYRVVPVGADRTRLILKIVGEFRWLVSLGVCVGDLVMARRQLLNFKRLAEAHRGSTRGA